MHQTPLGKGYDLEEVQSVFCFAAVPARAMEQKLAEDHPEGPHVKAGVLMPNM